MPHMATLETFTISFCFFFFLPHLAASATNCVESTCTPGGTPIRFPFWLRNLQPSSCGYPGFDLSCNNRTILTLPLSGDFIVQTISYRNQIVYIKDPDNCLPKRFLDHDFSLQDSPFSFADDPETYTFLNCSASQGETSSSAIACLSSDRHEVIVVPSGWSTSLSKDQALSQLSSCSVISTALVPPSLFAGESLSRSLQLAWQVPDCRSCEANGIICALDNSTSSQTLYPGSSKSASGLSRGAKYGLIIGVGIPGLFCIIGLAFQFCKGTMAQDQLHQPVTELLVNVIDRQPPVAAVGLDGPTIDSYPKTELGETLELPDPGNNTCPICLVEYKPKATLKTIPACNHYFHSSCIDEWLNLNATCPLCRHPPEGNKMSPQVIET